MKNNVLPNKSSNNSTIFAPFQSIVQSISLKISSFIVTKLIEWLGPYLHYDLERIIDEKDSNKKTPKYEIDSRDYESMKYIVRSFFQAQNKAHISFGQEKEIMNRVDRMSFDELKENFEVINKSFQACRKLTFEIPSEECKNESQLIQATNDKKDNQN